MHRLGMTVPLLFLLLYVPPAVSGMFKCTDASGDVVYSDKPCAGSAKAQDLSHIARAGRSRGPGEDVCRDVQGFATKVASLMRSGVESYNVMNRVGGTQAIDPVVLEVIGYVYSFKMNAGYDAGRIGGLTYNRCMGGGFSFPESMGGSGGGSSGTGFVVAVGYVVTNKHVVDSCRTIEITSGGATFPAKLLAKDDVRDLALLSVMLPGSGAAQFRSNGDPDLGESVIVAGYPLKGLLADDLQVTTGSVSALAGIRNDSKVVQISAPVQPGNSGGPLFDGSGNVIGVVVSKLNAVTMAEHTGDIPQNVNFAIKGELVKGFLTRSGVTILTSDLPAPAATTEIAARAREFVVPVVCR